MLDSYCRVRIKFELLKEILRMMTFDNHTGRGCSSPRFTTWFNWDTPGGTQKCLAGRYSGGCIEKSASNKEN